ncbi:response regulator [Paenibacillus eucommiae]|uniref:Two-component system response regulator YesN n=1 Tax=Paenibacillus eucommiae TaxID=1355755 RepID=A0ABS4JAG4_9BACL|nr:response regulator [Paenibacillus eucommiae]MBP1996830.1 two-component system response regulator YesN [Paenibacillus eucommiae]
MEQFKLVIIDDEPLIRKGLQTIIQRIAPQWIVVGTAVNGIEALAVIKDNKPDLIITDISMPHMDGISLFTELKKQAQTPHCLVLSGHSEFEYVRSMLLMGALDYLMKPIDSDLLSNQLLRVQTLISDEFHNKLKENEQNQNLREFWIHQLAHGNLYEVEECESKLYELGIPSQMQVYSFSALHFQIPEEEHRDRSTYRYFLFKTAEEIIAENGKVMRGEDGQIIVLTWGSSKEELLEILILLEETMIQFIHKCTRIKIFIGNSPIFEQFHQLQMAWSQAKLSVKFKSIFQNKIIWQNSNLISSKSIGTGKELFVLLQHGDMDKIKGTIERGFNNLDSLEDVPHYLEQYYMELLMRIEEFVILNGTSLEQISHLSLSEIVDKALDKPTSQELIASLICFAEMSLKQIMDNRSKLDPHFFTKIKRYIHDNLNNNLTLQSVAEHVQMNASYLSVLFKQATGQNFIDYVIEQRIELAKSLLKQDELKLYEITNLVGYQSSKHFSKLFKKIVGVLPSEYKRYLGN